MITKLTKEQAVIVAGYTGIMIGQFSDLHADIERRLGRPVWTHEFADKRLRKKIKELYREDFIAMSPHNPLHENRN